jgi:hypothetical protein
MLGATLRVNSQIADLCRHNSSVSTLVLDTKDWFIEVMFIDRGVAGCPPSAGGPCVSGFV